MFLELSQKVKLKLHHNSLLQVSLAIIFIINVRLHITKPKAQDIKLLKLWTTYFKCREVVSLIFNCAFVKGNPKIAIFFHKYA